MVGGLFRTEDDRLGGVGIAPGIGGNPILDTIGQYAPRLYKTTTNPRSRYMMACPLPGHQDAEHPDHSGSFSVNDAGTLFHCFGCGESGNAAALYLKLAPGGYAGPIPTARRSKPKVAVAGGYKPRGQTSAPFQGVTISQLVKAKGLDQDHVVEELGWQDMEFLGTPAIFFPYWDETHVQFQARYRVGLDRGGRFLWEKGAKACLYGLWELERIKKHGFVVLVEGESDYAVLDYRGFPVLAAPGASNFKPEWASLLSGIKDIYAWKEPDQGGETFIKRLAQYFPSLKVIIPPDGMKDPADMSVKMGDRLSDELHDLLDTAKQSEVGTTYYRGANFTDIRQAVAAAYQHGGNDDAATKVARCALWRRGYRYECGEIEGRTFHCGKRGCPNCTMVSLTHLFEEKQDVVGQIVTPYIAYVPAVYEACLVGLSREDMASEFNRGIGIARKLLSDWTKYEGKKCGLARNHIYSIRCKIDGNGVARFGFVIFGDEPITPVRPWFERRLGLPLRVNEERHLTLTDAIDRFKYLTVTGFAWSNHDQFLAWCDSQKQKKLVQGKGRFSGVSGSKGSARVPDATAICPTHGVEEPVTRLQLIGPPDVWNQVKSPFTNRTHYLLRVPLSSLITDDG